MIKAHGSPSYKNTKTIIEMNLIKKKNITCDNINLAQEIYGLNKGTIITKTTMS